MNHWGVGEIEPIHDLMRELRFGPGVLIILESTANGFDVHAVLNTIGSAVETELEWRWPAR